MEERYTLMMKCISCTVSKTDMARCWSKIANFLHSLVVNAPATVTRQNFAILFNIRPRSSAIAESARITIRWVIVADRLSSLTVNFISMIWLSIIFYRVLLCQLTRKTVSKADLIN